MCVDNSFCLNYSELKQLQHISISTDSNFGTFSLSNSLSASFFVLSNNFTASGVSNSNFYPAVILKNNPVFNPVHINLNWWILS